MGKDKLVIRKLKRKEVSEFGTKLLRDPNSVDIYEEHLIDLLMFSKTVVGIVYKNKAVAAMSYKKGKDTAEIISLIVKNEHRGKGLAKMLINYILFNSNKKLYIKPITDEVEKKIEKMGFEKEGEEKWVIE